MKYKVVAKVNLKYDGQVLKCDDESDFGKLSEQEIKKLLDQKYIVSVEDKKAEKTNPPKK